MSDEQLLADAAARAGLVAADIPAHTIAALYPTDPRVESYLRDGCQLEPWVEVLPTADPRWWKMIEVCDTSCHHPVHAFGHPERLRHLVEVPPFSRG